MVEAARDSQGEETGRVRGRGVTTRRSVSLDQFAKVRNGRDYYPLVGPTTPADEPIWELYC